MYLCCLSRPRFSVAPWGGVPSLPTLSQHSLSLHPWWWRDRVRKGGHTSLHSTLLLDSLSSREVCALHAVECEGDIFVPTSHTSPQSHSPSSCDSFFCACTAPCWVVFFTDWCAFPPCWVGWGGGGVELLLCCYRRLSNTPMWPCSTTRRKK